MYLKYNLIQTYKFSGIYCIKNIVNNKIYIGSAVNIRNRLQLHIKQLNNNIHCNTHLQRAWNKYGEENFVFEILAKSPKEYLIKLEQWFLDNLNPSYNICKKAGSTLGVHMKEHVKEKLKAANKNRVISEETRKKMSNAHKNRTFTKEHLDKIIQSKKDKYGKSLMTEKARIKLSKLAKDRLTGKRWEDIYSEDTVRKLKENIAKRNKERYNKCGLPENFIKNGKKWKDTLKGKSFEDIYGKEKASEIKSKLSNSLRNSELKKKSNKIGGLKRRGIKQDLEWIKNRIEPLQKSIKCINHNTKTEKIYNSVKEASEQEKVSITTIINSAKNNSIMKRKKLQFIYL